MNKLQAGWSTLRVSFDVLASNKTLLVFPIVSGAATVVIALFFLAPLLLLNLGQNAGIADAAVIYVFSMFVATFFNVAFYHAILNAFRGDEVSVSESLSFASTKLPAIFMWSLFAGLIGLLIKRLEERAGLIGKFVIGLIGATWSIASTFAIPAIVVSQETNPLEILKTSAATIRKAWGEDLVGFVGFGILNLLVGLGSMLWIGIAVVVAFGGHWGAFWLSLGLWFVATGVALYVMNVAAQVFRCALFVYATDGTLPAGYTPEQIEGAWKKRS